MKLSYGQNRYRMIQRLHKDYRDVDLTFLGHLITGVGILPDPDNALEIELRVRKALDALKGK